MDAQLRISRGKTLLLGSHPFWASIIMNLRVVETKDIPTAATDGISLFYNPEFIESLNDEEVKFLLAHEACHVALKHMLRMGDRHSRKWNYAADFAINDMLKLDGFKFIEGGLHKEEFRDMTSEAIYEVLPGDTEEENDKLYGGEEEHILAPCHPDGTPLSDDELEELEVTTERQLKIASEIAKGIGKLPAGMKDIIDELLEPKIDWRDKFRRHVQGDNPEDFSYRRPNRRMLQSSGLYMPTIHKLGASPIIIGVDTSGSISQEELQIFLSEINSIWEDCCPEQLTIIEIDTELQDVKVFEPGDDLSTYEFTGRGGTQMKPFFDWVEENGDGTENLVLFTDMEFWFDDLIEPDQPMLWITTGRRDCPFGDIVKVV